MRIVPPKILSHTMLEQDNNNLSLIFPSPILRPSITYVIYQIQHYTMQSCSSSMLDALSANLSNLLLPPTRSLLLPLHHVPLMRFICRRHILRCYTTMPSYLLLLMFQKALWASLLGGFLVAEDE